MTILLKTANYTVEMKETGEHIGAPDKLFAICSASTRPSHLHVRPCSAETRPSF